ncbi:MAG: 3-keto-5-aminohexanoate cleavage protein [Armatimonadetes bacterium]|nr:3-keto-5-aminohexanoate cleavage protein [Armatimonadota bacterium]
MDKLIITAALTGAEVTLKDNPNLPITPRELADAAVAACDAGASIVHLHVREEDGSPSLSPDLFKETSRLIRARSDVILQFSTGGAVGMTGEERMRHLSLRPEMATLSSGSINFGADVFLNPQGMIEALAGEMQKLGITPEIEVFDIAMIRNALRLVKKGLLSFPLHFDFVMGVEGGIPASMKNLLFLSEAIPQGCTWSVAGMGRDELPMAVGAILLGGHVRVGLEDNIYYSRGVLAESNAQLVARVARISADLGRELAGPGEARKILNMRSVIQTNVLQKSS